MQVLTEMLGLNEAQGIEWFTIHNMVGAPRKFKKVDGFWEKPSEARDWMKSNESAHRPNVRMSKALQAAQAKYGSHVPLETLKAWISADVEDARAARAEEKAAKVAKQSLDTIWQKFEEAHGDSFPDGDPMDRWWPWAKSHGVTVDDLNRATRKFNKGVKTYTEYMARAWDDYAADAYHDAKQGAHGETYDHMWFTQENPWK